MDYFRKNKKPVFILLASLIVFVAIFCYVFLNKDNQDSFNKSLKSEIIKLTEEEDYSKIVLKINQKLVEVEVVFSNEAKTLGLSNRSELLNQQGMLFIFNNYNYPSFHMKNMNFPLDLLFIKDGIVKKIFSSVAPEGENPKNYYRFGPVDMVLELPALYTQEYNINEGDILETNN